MYYGKIIDTFEPAINMLLNNQKIKPPPFLDCISGRCFAFKYGNYWSNRLGPLISCKDAVKNLSYNIILPQKQLVCHKIDMIDDIERLLHKGVVIGPLKDSLDLPTGLELYFHSDYQYVFAKMHTDNQVIIQNPLGRSEILLQMFDLACKIKGMNIIYLMDSEQAEKPLELFSILNHGLELRHLHQREQWSIMLQELGEGEYRLTGRDYTALQYGLIYYLQQYQKSYSLAAACGVAAEIKQMHMLVSEIYLLRTRFCSLDFMRLDQELWRLIDEKQN